jgi:hypothetical protein
MWGGWWFVVGWAWTCMNEARLATSDCSLGPTDRKRVVAGSPVVAIPK